MSTYNFSVNQENQQIFYRMFTFISYSGRFAISYIKLFGDVIKEEDNPPKEKAERSDYSIKYNAMPYIEALLEKQYLLLEMFYLRRILTKNIYCLKKSEKCMS